MQIEEAWRSLAMRLYARPSEFQLPGTVEPDCSYYSSSGHSISQLKFRKTARILWTTPAAYTPAIASGIDSRDFARCIQIYSQVLETWKFDLDQSLGINSCCHDTHFEQGCSCVDRATLLHDQVKTFTCRSRLVGLEWTVRNGSFQHIGPSHRLSS